MDQEHSVIYPLDLLKVRFRHSMFAGPFIKRITDSTPNCQSISWRRLHEHDQRIQQGEEHGGDASDVARYLKCDFGSWYVYIKK